MRYFIFLLLVYFYPMVTESKQIVQISIPKSGTHLLAKCIELITGNRMEAEFPGVRMPSGFYRLSQQHFNYFTKELPDNTFWVTHLMYQEKYARQLNDHKFIKFFIYRDPRDQVVSLAFYMRQMKQKWLVASRQPFDLLIMDLIKRSRFARSKPPASGIADLYRKYLPWMETPGFYCVCFEDLVGQEGGGSKERQFQVIKEIVNHLGLDRSDEEIYDIIKELFGGTSTFRKGQIGAWREYFTDEHKSAFKEHAGQLLIDLGYEKNFNW